MPRLPFQGPPASMARWESRSRGCDHAEQRRAGWAYGEWPANDQPGQGRSWGGTPNAQPADTNLHNALHNAQPADSHGDSNAVTDQPAVADQTPAVADSNAAEHLMSFQTARPFPWRMQFPLKRDWRSPLSMPCALCVRIPRTAEISLTFDVFGPDLEAAPIIFVAWPLYSQSSTIGRPAIEP